MNYTMHSAGRATHLKIVVLSLVGAIVVVLVGLNARTTEISSIYLKTSGAVVKAVRPGTFAGQETPTIR